MTNLDLSTTETNTLHRRVGERRRLAVAGRLTWRDTNGALRFASVVTRDVSEADVFVECQAPASIPKYRLVHFQVERAAQSRPDLPAALRGGKQLTAIYRVGPCEASTGTPKGYALRLLSAPAKTKAPSAPVAGPLAVAN
jgi:hypothetical protein